MLYFFLHISYEEKSDQWTYFQYLSKLCVYLTLVKTYSNIFFPHKGCRGWEKCCNFLSTIIFRYKIKSLKNQKHYERTLEKNLSFILCEIWTFISQQIESIKLKIIFLYFLQNLGKICQVQYYEHSISKGQQYNQCFHVLACVNF